MKILIVEDEPLAAERLKELVIGYASDALVLGPLDSVRQTIKWFTKNENPDVVLMDIQLADGLSFEIFDQAEVSCPVIFTTAFDAYALRAFKVNSIDYLLKPINKEDLYAALEKYERLYKSSDGMTSSGQQAIEQICRMMMKNHRSRFLIRVGEHLRPLETVDVACFYAEQRATFATTKRGQCYDIDFTLDQLEQELDPAHFFRVNRGMLVQLDAIRDVVIYSGSRLCLKLQVDTERPILVSRERVGAFKKWMEG